MECPNIFVKFSEFWNAEKSSAGCRFVKLISYELGFLRFQYPSLRRKFSFDIGMSKIFVSNAHVENAIAFR